MTTAIIILIGLIVGVAVTLVAAKYLAYGVSDTEGMFMAVLMGLVFAITWPWSLPLIGAGLIIYGVVRLIQKIAGV